MKPAHTPGPWRLAGRLFDVVYDANDRLVAQMPMDTRREELKANARLIAAAPEMLENLRELVAFYGAHGGPMATSRALLARIDGTA